MRPDVPERADVKENVFPLHWTEGAGCAGMSVLQLQIMNNFMEQINKIELIGIVGSVRLQHINDRQMAKFSVVTNRAYKNKEGAPVIETTWHNVTAFEGKNVQDLERIQKGCPIRVIGRLQIQRYTGMDGFERTAVDVICTHLYHLPEGTEVQYEI